MATHGFITVSWPFDDGFDFATRFARIRPTLFDHGFDHRAITSSSFVGFVGSEATATDLREAVAAIDTAFTVTWEEGEPDPDRP